MAHFNVAGVPGIHLQIKRPGQRVCRSRVKNDICTDARSNTSINYVITRIDSNITSQDDVLRSLEIHFSIICINIS